MLPFVFSIFFIFYIGFLYMTHFPNNVAIKGFFKLGNIWLKITSVSPSKRDMKLLDELFIIWFGLAFDESVFLLHVVLDGIRDSEARLIFILPNSDSEMFLSPAQI